MATLTVLVPFPGIYNTGLSDSRTVLADSLVDPHYKFGGTLLEGGAPDPHYLLMVSPDPTYGGPTGFVLEETTALPGGWTNSPAKDTVDGNQNVAVIAPDGTARFFRLRK